RVALDGDQLENIPWPRRGDRLWLEHDGKRWQGTGPPATSRKGMRRYGPFKDLFRNRMLFVYGTRGAPAENGWGPAKARYAGEQLLYRGKGWVDVVADMASDRKQEPDRNVVLYGNADGNAAWEALLGGGPVQVRRGKLRVGGREEAANDLACLFVRPRPGSDTALAGAVSRTGLAGRPLPARPPPPPSAS